MSDTASRRQIISALGAATLVGCDRAHGHETRLLNVSYDPTREFYAAFNARFIPEWTRAHGGGLRVDQSHGGSGKQARSVIEGLQADVVTLALAYDIDVIAKHGLLAPDWQKRLPDNSTPFASTIVFLVRKGNPKAIRDWPDLVKPGVQVVTPNPKTSGGARWNFLAAWAWAQKTGRRKGGGDLSARALRPRPRPRHRGAGRDDQLRPAPDRRRVDRVGERGASVRKQLAGQVEIVRPSYSVLAEPPVAVVDKIVDAHGARAVAQAYLEALWRDWAQDLGAQNFFRPRVAAVAARWTSQFPDLPMATIADFGGWEAAQQRFFADGEVFDQIYQTKH